MFEETRSKYKSDPDAIKDKATASLGAVAKSRTTPELSKVESDLEKGATLDHLKERPGATSALFDDYNKGHGDTKYEQAKLSAEEIVSQVSAGKILHGILVTEDITSITTETDQLIKCPQNIKLLSPDLPEKYDIVDIASKEQHIEFDTAIATMGISVATQIAAKGWQRTLEIGGAYDRKSKMEQTKSSSSQRMYISKSVYHSIPVHAVRLSVGNMQLTDLALSSLKQLEDMLTQRTATEESLKYIFRSVDSFYRKYGSHINRGLIHLGGIYVQNGTYELEKTTTDTKTVDMVTSAVQSNFSVGFKLFSVAEVGVANKTNYDSSQGKLQKRYDEAELSKICIRVTKQGGLPSVGSVEQWQKSLIETNNYLAIIDRGSSFDGSFGGIWEILHNHSEYFVYYKGLALFLKYAWYAKYGEMRNFFIDSEDHAHQFIEMILERKLNWIKERTGKSECTFPIFRFVKLCQKVTGERNAKYQDVVAKISTLLPQASSALENLTKYTWVAQSPFGGSSDVIGGIALENDGVVVTTVKGNLVDQCVDVIVNTTNTSLSLDTGGVSAAILTAAGPGILKECKRTSPGGVNHGEIVVTAGYNLNCKKVYHTALPDWSSSNAVKCLMSMISTCLETAHQDSFKCIAFPALGTGLLGYPKERVASIMYQQIALFVEKHCTTTLCDIRIVVFDKDTKSIQAFEEKVRSLGHTQLTD